MEWIVWFLVAAVFFLLANAVFKDGLQVIKPSLEDRVANLERWVHIHAPFIKTDPVPAPEITHGEKADRFPWEDIP